MVYNNCSWYRHSYILDDFLVLASSCSNSSCRSFFLYYTTVFVFRAATSPTVNDDEFPPEVYEFVNYCWSHHYPKFFITVACRELREHVICCSWYQFIIPPHLFRGICYQVPCQKSNQFKMCHIQLVLQTLAVACNLIF